MNEGVPVHGSGSDFAMVVANMGLFGRRENPKFHVVFSEPPFFFFQQTRIQGLMRFLSCGSSETIFIY